MSNPGACTCPEDVGDPTRVHVEVATCRASRWTRQTTERPARYALPDSLSISAVAEGYCITTTITVEGIRHHPLVSAFDAEKCPGTTPSGDRWAWCPECHLYQRVVSPHPSADG